MHLFGPVEVGIAIIVLLAALVAIKRVATGAVLDKPQGTWLIQLVNIFNLFFLLLVNPAAAIGLILRRLEMLDPTHLEIQAGLLLASVEVLGTLLYLTGFLLMGWALLTLRRNYQLGGSTPRAQDRLVVDGPYALIRHPMYAGALAIALGLSCLTQSLAFLAVFVIYVALLSGLIPMEEHSLEAAYGALYLDYERRTKLLIPAIY